MSDQEDDRIEEHDDALEGGPLGTQVALLRNDMKYMAREMRYVRGEVSRLTTILHQVQGGWRVLGVVAATGGAIAGFAGSWLIKKIGS